MLPQLDVRSNWLQDDLGAFTKDGCLSTSKTVDITHFLLKSYNPTRTISSVHNGVFCCGHSIFCIKKTTGTHTHTAGGYDLVSITG